MQETNAEEYPSDKVGGAPQKPGVPVVFRNIEYSVNLKEPKKILCGVSGAVAAGEILCILGPSGGGKTSLVQIIGKKIASTSKKIIGGTVLVNDQQLDAQQLNRIAGFVTQEDVFEAALSVAETLKFQAYLKLKASAVEREERVLHVVAKLQLEKCLATYVGDDSSPYLKGISGGEKRRLAIACEIMDPNIKFLVMDEPTSGLDAAAALNVANVLRQLADDGITALGSFHQPRAAIMQRFDRVLMLAAGQTMYFGPLKDFVPYLQTSLQCELPVHESPYDLFLDVLNPAMTQARECVRALPQDCCDVAQFLAGVFSESELAASLKQRVQPGALPVDAAFSCAAVNRINPCLACAVLFCRIFIVKMRDPIVMMTQIFSAIFLGLIFGALFFDTWEKPYSFAVLDTQMGVSMCVIIIVWLPYDVTLTFPKERRVFLRERNAGLYTTAPFYLARITADMPIHIVTATILSLIFWLLANLRQSYFEFWLVCVCSILVGASVMQAVGAASRTFEEANIIMMTALMTSMMCSTGFLREVPSWLMWLREISVMGLLADIGLYMEFRTADTASDIFSEFGGMVKDDAELRKAILVTAGIFVVCRFAAYLSVKFLHTGRTFTQNLKD